jgi:sterol-4alpha-carboxylate 3-dehydrogenase (decarboxylating)
MTMANALNVELPGISIPSPLPEITGMVLDNTWGLFAKPPLSLVQVRYLTENRAFSYEKARKILGYAPDVRLEEGMKRTVEWYKKQKLLV